MNLGMGSELRVNPSRRPGRETFQPAAELRDSAEVYTELGTSERIKNEGETRRTGRDVGDQRRPGGLKETRRILLLEDHHNNKSMRLNRKRNYT